VPAKWRCQRSWFHRFEWRQFDRGQFRGQWRHRQGRTAATIVARLSFRFPKSPEIFMSDTILVVAVLSIYLGETAKVLFADWILNQASKRAQAQVGRVIAQPVQASSSPAHFGELGGETETVEAGRHERSDMRDRTVTYCTVPGCRCAHPG
jgi:hypothetical protein